MNLDKQAPIYRLAYRSILRGRHSREDRGMARRPPPGRGLGDSICLPVDTSSRPFQRSCSEPRFPFASIDKDSVLIKTIPISLRWSSFLADGDANCAKALHGAVNAAMAPAEQEPSRRVVDPHRTGFGRISATAPRVRSPPACKVTNGILGVHPAEATRGDDPVDKRGVEKSIGGDETKVEDDKPLRTSSSPDLGFRPASFPASPLLPKPSRAASIYL